MVGFVRATVIGGAVLIAVSILAPAAVIHRSPYKFHGREAGNAVA